MRPNEYQVACIRTTIDKYKNLDLVQPYADLLHAHLGMSSEVGEIGDCLKKHFIYGQPLDSDNLVEECGDLMWYICLMLSTAACVSTLEECMQKNIDKLKLRYPEKFTEQDALERKDKQ